MFTKGSQELDQTRKSEMDGCTLLRVVANPRGDGEAEEVENLVDLFWVF